ncbi:MAG: ATP-binding protein [Clostridia bacterium]|nr:ATP-binding protein [Clostridia bacterium]
MGKLIAVCGSPNSGKTTCALKLAQEIYHAKKTSVFFVSPDMNVPCMAYLFPNGKDAELFSLGVALDKTDIYKEDILSQTVNVKTMQNFGFLGFKLGENSYSYPRPTEDKVTEMFTVIKESAEYIIVDCTCERDDIISSIAKRDCDCAIQLFTPDLRCISYYASCVNQFLMIEDRKVKVLNIMDNDIYLPIHETETHFHGMDFSLPYERDLKQQMITGTLSERLGSCKFRAEVEKLAKAVM